MSTTTFSLADFFARHFSDLGTDERIEIRAFPQGGAGVQQSWHPTPLAAAQAALRLPQHLNIFFGIQARRDRGGKKADVTKVRVLWADMDFKHYTDGREGALQAIKDFPLPPTVVVDSGNGFHLYWYLAAAIEPSAAIEQLLGRLYKRLGGLDAVQDLSRVLRVPETFNNKTTPAKLAQVRHTEYEAVYTLADFEALLPAPVEPERVAWSPLTNGGGRSAYSDIPSIAEMREILRFIPPGGDYKADWLRFLAAVHSVYPGPEGVAMCEEWCPGKPGEVSRKFASFRRDGHASDAAGVGTLIYTAKQYGYELPRRTQASPKFTIPQSDPADDGEVIDVLEMAQALDTAQREIVTLTARLERCREEHTRKDVHIAALESTVAAYEASTMHPDQTIGGSVFDIVEAATAAYERGDTLVHEGKEFARVVCKQAAKRRSAGTVGRGIKKIAEHDPSAVLVREEEIETDRYRGTVEISYIHIPQDERRAPGRAVLTLLPPPGEKSHGGARRKIDLPDFDEPVTGPVKVVTEKKRIWSSVATEKTLLVETLDSHTEHFAEDGTQMIAAEVDEFKIGIGMKVREPAYRPIVQMALTPEDIELTTIPHADLPNTGCPIPLYGSCAWQGCTLPALKDQPLCSRHTATHSYSMTGAD